MEDVLTIHLPSEVGQMLNRTPEELARDVQLYAALMLFRLGKLSSGVAAEMAGVPRVAFLDQCPKPVHKCWQKQNRVFLGEHCHAKAQGTE